MTALTCELLTGAADFARISARILELRLNLGVEDDLHTDPVCFLASTDATRRPCCVACWRGDRLVGVLFATAHYLGGIIPIGYAAAGDYSGRGSLLCAPEDRSLVADATSRCLLDHGIHSLHLRLAAPVRLNPGPGISYTELKDTIPGDRLALAATYEEFLASLGKHTRRNIRSSTRRAAAAGMAFLPDPPWDDYLAGVRLLSRTSRFPLVARRNARDQRLISLYSGRCFALRDSAGRIVAALCGFSRNGRFHLLSQINDASLARLSLSLVLRGYTIESLIAGGDTEVQFMGGASLTLGRFCAPMEYQSCFLDRPHVLFTPLKKLAARAVESLAAHNRVAPSSIESFCSGFLSPARIAARTPLAPAAVVRQETLVRQRKFAQPERDANAKPDPRTA